MSTSSVVYSVIMPCYNSAGYVENALQSIVNQTYPHWELIAINDGSTDNTLDILNGYAKQDSRIKVFSKPNGGYVSAVNEGLSKVTGDYFLFLGSDDRLDVGLFEALTNAVQQCEQFPDGIAFRALQIKKGVSIGNDAFTDFSELSYEPNCTLKEYIEKHPKGAAILTCRDTAKCFKREKLEDLRYFGRYGIDADGIFSMLFYHNCSSFLSVPYDGYLWTIREGSLSGSTSIEKEIDRIRVWREFFEYLTKFNPSNVCIEATSHISLQCYLCITLCRKFSVACKYRRFIREQLKFIKQTANLYSANEFIDKKISFLSFSPPLYSILYKLHFWQGIHKLKSLFKK